MRISTHGRLASKKNNRGVTLIEVLVSLAIVGLIVGLAASALRDAFDVGLKNSSNRIASLVRYVRSKAITDRKYLRLALDIGESQYWVEMSADPFVISPEENPPEKSEEEGETGKAAFEELDDSLASRRKLEGDTFFKDVSVSYLPEKREEGQVFVYFFPDGYITPSLINLRNEEDEDHYSIEIFPLSGRVSIEGEYREMERK